MVINYIFFRILKNPNLNKKLFNAIQSKKIPAWTKNPK